MARIGGVGWIALACLVLIVAPVAGCLGGSDGGPDTNTSSGNESTDQPPQGAGTIPWGMSNCRVVVAIVPVDEAALAEHIPEGLEPVSAEEAFGLPPDPRGEGAIGLETFQCEQAVGLNGTLENLAYGAVFVPVEAPQNVTLPDVDTVFWKGETLVPDDERREALTELGLPAVDGSSDLSGLAETPTGHTFDVSVTLDDATFTFTGSADQPNEAFREGFPFAELQTGDAGFAQWICLENSAEGGNSGAGTVALGPGHWTSEVVGAETTQAYMVASTNVTFEQAHIQLP